MSTLPSSLRLPFRGQAPAGPSPEDKREEREERETIPSFELLQGMSLWDFRKSGLVMVVRCAVLKDEVVFAADGTETSLHGFDEKGRVVYRGEELRLLTVLANPEDLVAYHSLRKQVGEVEVHSIGMAPPDEVMEEKPKKKKGAAA